MSRLAERRRRRSIRRIGAFAVALGIVGAVAGLVAPSYGGDPAAAFPIPAAPTTGADGVRPIDRTTPPSKTKESPDAPASDTPSPGADRPPDDRRTPATTATGASPTGTRSGDGPARPPVVDDQPDAGGGGQGGEPGTGGPPHDPAPGSGAGDPAPSGDDVLDLVNAHRATAGCPALVIDAGLDATAQSWSEAQGAADTMSHSPGAGATYGENVAVGYPTADEVVAAWMASEGHRANILNCEYRTTGTGYAPDDTGPYWTQTFGS